MDEPNSSLPAIPVPARIRHDGWTVARQEAFLRALAACGCITDACRAVGMSRQSARNFYNRAAAGFRRAFDAALDCGGPMVESGAWERSIKGVARPIFYRGKQVGEYRHYDERLTMFLLRYRRGQRFGAHLDRFQPPPLPPIPGLDPWESQPDPDEAIGSLGFHLDELIDEADLPDDPAHAIDGDNFDNFVTCDGAQSRPAEGDSASIAETNAEVGENRSNHVQHDDDPGHPSP